MNRIEKLLQKLCPDGVEFKALVEVCDLTRGRVISQDYLRKNAGQYPVYSSQTKDNGIFGRINSFDFDGEYVSWTTDGANAGSVFYINEKFSVTNVCGLLKIKDSNLLNAKFLYFALCIKAKKYVNYSCGNPKLMSNKMATIKIPINSKRNCFDFGRLYRITSRITSAPKTIRTLPRKAFKL